LQAIITVGISGSGKSTWADEFLKNHKNYDHWMIVCRDEIRKGILRGKNINPDLPGSLWGNWKWKWEEQVTKNYWKQVENAYAGGYNIICADTNLNKDRLYQFQEKLKSIGYKVIEIKEFPISYEEAVKHDLFRLHSVGSQVIYKQYQQWLEYIGRKKYIADISKPPCIIVDVDGTICTMNGRSPYDYSKVDTDLPRWEIIDLIKGFKLQEYIILIVSGRDSSCREQTISWLNLYGVPYDKFFMRKENDNRDDRIIKEELFWEYIAPNYNVKLVCDDRVRVVQRWIELGLKVACVGNPWIEF
jgi:hypothetical protein